MFFFFLLCAKKSHEIKNCLKIGSTGVPTYKKKEYEYDNLIIFGALYQWAFTAPHQYWMGFWMQRIGFTNNLAHSYVFFFFNAAIWCKNICLPETACKVSFWQMPSSPPSEKGSELLFSGRYSSGWQTFKIHYCCLLMPIFVVDYFFLLLYGNFTLWDHTTTVNQ